MVKGPPSSSSRGNLALLVVSLERAFEAISSLFHFTFLYFLLDWTLDLFHSTLPHAEQELKC